MTRGNTDDARPSPSSGQPRKAGIWDLWIAYRWVALLLAIFIATLAYPLAQRMRYDRSIENMFAPDDPIVTSYREFKQVFGSDYVVLAVYRDPELWSEAGLERVAQVTQRLERVPGVRDVLSLSVLSGLLERLNSSLLDDGPLATAYRELFEGYTHSDRGDVAAVVCLLEDMPLAGNKMQRTIAELRSALSQSSLPIEDGVLVGEPVMVCDGFHYLEQDAERLGWLSSLLLAGTIILCLRSVRWVVIALAVVQWTILVTKATLALTDVRLSMVSSMLSAVVTVIGIATVMHLAVLIRDHRARGLRPRTAVSHAFSVLFLPIMWAIITDTIGFLSLLLADVGPVRDFGIMMAIASALVIPAILLIVPPLAMLGTERQEPWWWERRLDGVPPSKRGLGPRRLERALATLARLVFDRPYGVAAGVLLVVAFAAAGIQRLEVETDFTKNFRQTSPIARAYAFVEERLGGAGVWDVMVPAPAILTENYLSRVRELQNQLRGIPAAEDPQRPALTKVLSLVDALDAASERPLLSVLPVELRLQGLRTAMPDFIGALHAVDPQTDQAYLRIMLRAPDRRDATAKQQLISRVREAVDRVFPSEDNPRAKAEVTGYFVLLTNLVVSMLRDQWVCFTATIIGVGLSIAVALRNVRWAAAALISNAFPIIATLGTLGWLGLRLNMGAAMIAAVSMGLSVDSSIHYLYAYRRARRAGGTVAMALGEAQRTVGRAMVFSTVALMIGFSALATSQFVPTIYFGALGSISLFGGLLGNLIILPLLLRWEGEWLTRSGQP